jgi:hypothetical protein
VPCDAARAYTYTMTKKGASQPDPNIPPMERPKRGRDPEILAKKEAEAAEYASDVAVVPADASTRSRLELALALRDEKSFPKTDRHDNARGVLSYFAIQGGEKCHDRYVAATPNSELIGIFDGHVVVCFEKDEHPRVLRLLAEAKTVLAPTTTLARTPRQVVDDLEGFVTNCGYKIKDDGTLEELSEGRQGEWRSPRNVYDFLTAQSKEVGLGDHWRNWRKKGRTPSWAPPTASGGLPSWGSKTPYWLAATAAAHELIDARERLDGISDEARTSDEAAAKQAAFSRYYFQVTDKLTAFEVAALEKLDEAGIRKRVARRAKALDARKSAGSQKAGHASVAAGSIPKANAARQKAQAQSIAQGTNLSRFERKPAAAGGLVPYNAEDGFARQRDRKACFEPADARDWLD